MSKQSSGTLQLLIGTCIPFIKKPGDFKYKRIIIYFSIITFAFLSFLYTKQIKFPGINALYVCLLTALIISFGEKNSLLSFKPLVYVGKMSYSIYLWHWPFIAFSTYIGFKISLWAALIFILIILAISHLSYQYIETPARRSRWSFNKSLSFMFILPLSMTIIGVTVVRINKGVPQRLGQELVSVDKTLLPYAEARQKYCHDYTGKNWEQCIFGDTSSATEALLLGDSHAHHYSEFVELLGKNAHVKVLGITFSECLMFPGLTQGSHRENNHDCVAATQYGYELIKQKKIKYVFIAQRWIGYPLADLSKLDGIMTEIITSGARPIILGPVAEDGTNKKGCFYQHIKFREKYSGECTITRDNAFEKEKKAAVIQLFETLQKKYPELLYIDTQSLQCSQDKCETVIDGLPIYDDTRHINGFGSRYFAEEYLKRFKNPLL